MNKRIKKKRRKEQQLDQVLRAALTGVDLKAEFGVDIEQPFPKRELTVDEFLAEMEAHRLKKQQGLQSGE